MLKSIYEFPIRSQCNQILLRLKGGMIMSDSEDQPVLAQYQKINLAVVEVCNGESREEAWRRYLAEHPESVGVRRQDFPLPEPESPQFMTAWSQSILYEAH